MGCGVGVLLRVEVWLGWVWIFILLALLNLRACSMFHADPGHWGFNVLGEGTHACKWDMCAFCAESILCVIMFGAGAFAVAIVWVL